MSFDGLVTRGVANELSKVLTGGKIEKIYQPENDELVLHIHAGKERHKLYLSSNSSHARIHLTEGADNNPPNPSSFCMLLRKHIQGGRISSIEQKDAERIVEISVDTINEMGFSVNKKLIIEIMGKHSNIILVDLTTDRILDSIKRVSIDISRLRQILPGHTYTAPPAQDKISPFKLTETKLADLLNADIATPVKRMVNTIQGLSPAIAEEMLLRSTGGILPASCGEISVPALFTVLKTMLTQLQNGDLTPVVYSDQEEKPQDFHVYSLQTLEDGSQRHAFEKVSQAIEYYYSNRASSNRVKQKSGDVQRSVSTHLDKLYLKKQRLSEDLIQAENSDIYRLYGELLTANIHAVSTGADKAAVMNYYTGESISIPLDARFSAAKNAQRYYKKYGKAKTAIKEKKIQLDETNEDVAYLESVMTFILQADTFEEVEVIRQELVDSGYLRRKKTNQKQQKNKLEPYSYQSRDGFRILVGRNNKENDHLTLKMADRKDIWFHTKDIPGSHVILFTEGRQPTESAIIEAAQLAAYYSKGRQSENVPVDYTQVRYVKKPSGAKPGMVIFTDNRTIYAKPALPEK